MWHKNSDFRDRVMILYQVVSVYELVKLHVLTRLLFVQRVFGSESFFFLSALVNAVLSSTHRTSLFSLLLSIPPQRIPSSSCFSS